MCPRQYKLIFMDISMPIMDGYEATLTIRKYEEFNLSEDEATSHIVGLTAHATDAYKEKCFESGMN